MRGLTAEEYAFMKAQDRSCGGCSRIPEFTVNEDSMARRLAVRGLLSPEQCARTPGAKHFTPTTDGRVIIAVHEQLIALYGGPA